MPFEVMESSGIRVHVQYEYITPGELGNQLIRLQSAARSLAGISRVRWVDYLEGKPHLIVKSFQTQHSVEYWLAVANLAATITHPLWAPFAMLMWKRLMAALYFFIKGELPQQQASDPSVQVTLDSGTEDDLRIFLKPDSLTDEEFQKLASLVTALTNPSNRVTFQYEETQITILCSKKRRRRR